jgi:hypothetical protein
VTYADKVLKKGTPELVAALESGHIGVRPAAAIADLPPDAQREALDLLDPPAATPSAPMNETEALAFLSHIGA